MPWRAQRVLPIVMGRIVAVGCRIGPLVTIMASPSGSAGGRHACGGWCLPRGCPVGGRGISAVPVGSGHPVGDAGRSHCRGRVIRRAVSERLRVEAVGTGYTQSGRLLPVPGATAGKERQWKGCRVR
jgi:hypothetical protein